jgi:hypothetical protein
MACIPTRSREGCFCTRTSRSRPNSNYRDEEFGGQNQSTQVSVRHRASVDLYVSIKCFVRNEKHGDDGQIQVSRGLDGFFGDHEAC